MEANATKITALILAIGIGSVNQTYSFGNGKKEGGRMERAADSIWISLTSSRYLKEEDIDACRLEKDCYSQVAEKWKMAGIQQKIQACDGFVEIGAQLKPASEETPQRYGPYLVEENLIELLVEALSDEDRELRNKASRILARETPDSLVRDHSFAIEAAIRKHPEIGDGARLVGKLASNRARKLLKTSKALHDDDSLVVAAVFGKLGDADQEGELIEAYRSETDHREKEDLALLLGYMARPKSLLVLAQDLRSPFFYEWNQRGKRSFRLHVIEALSLAYPQEPVLWKPFPHPRRDEYYAEIEKWAERVLGVEWKNPRPPFLYEEQVPIPKRPMKP